MSRLEDVINAEKARLSQRNTPTETEKPGSVVIDMPNRRVAYQAFGAPTNDPQIRLIIYARQMFLMPRYDVLLDVAFNGRYDFIGLIYTHQRVRIYGRNLAELVFALRLNCVEYIREFAETHHLAPDDLSLPMITEIQIDGTSTTPFEKDLQC